MGNLFCVLWIKIPMKVYNYKQISDGIDYKNPRQRELVIQALHKLQGAERIKETEKGKYIVNLKIAGTLTGFIDFNQCLEMPT